MGIAIFATTDNPDDVPLSLEVKITLKDLKLIRRVLKDYILTHNEYWPFEAFVEGLNSVVDDLEKTHWAGRSTEDEDKP